MICDYLEAVYPEPPLYPSEPGAQAYVKQIMKVAELYLELPSRKLIPYAFSDQAAPAAARAEACHVISRGIGAMRRLCAFSPWIAGECFSLADIYVHYVNAVVQGVGSRQLEWDIPAEIPGMWHWHQRMAATPIAQQVAADRRANEPHFHAYITRYLADNPWPPASART